MRYRPRYTEPIRLLEALGYSGEDTNRGYVRACGGNKDRFHALIELGGVIDLHRDICTGKKHTIHKFTKSLEAEIQNMKRQDLKSATLIQRLLDLFTNKHKE